MLQWYALLVIYKLVYFNNILIIREKHSPQKSVQRLKYCINVTLLLTMYYTHPKMADMDHLSGIELTFNFVQLACLLVDLLQPFCF